MISPITGGYRLPGCVNGVDITLLLDTGAAVTLLRQDVWAKVAASPDSPAQLGSWTGASLVSAGGTPLTVHGCACLALNLGGKIFPTNFVVVSPLTSEAILGIDFLQAQQAKIDLGEKTVCLRESGCNIRLDSPVPEKSCPLEHHVRTVHTVEVPPRSVVETPAYSDATMEGVWLVEEAMGKHAEVAVARAIVQPQSSTFPVAILNVLDEPITLYAGSVVATMSPINLPTEVAPVGRQGAKDVSDEKQQVLWQLVQESGAELSPGEKQIFYELLHTHADVLASSTADLGRTSKLQHKIDTGNSPPIRQAVRRLSPHRREEVKQLLSEMLARGVIEPSSSPWASPVVLVRKKDGSTRFCVDYRKLNQVTRKDAYPLPRIDMTLDALHGSQWFSTLDLVSGYWQVELEEADKEKTAFCTTEGLYQFKVMPFGLCNAPASFQRLMDLVLTGLQWSQCLVYLDDIVVLGCSFEEHIRNLHSVLQRLQESGLRLKPTKCAFFKKEVKYLGHIISRNGVATDPDKTAKVASWPVPTSKREVQQFVGFANYYRRFIKAFAQLARPLHRLTEQGVPFKWTDSCQEAFDQLRARLCSSPVLAYPDFSKPFILDTDASDVGISGVLSQLDSEGRERVIAFGSRLLTKPERQYCVTRRELLAVVTFIRQYRPYLICRRFTLRTDHGSLTWLRNFREPEGQLARWLEQLQELEFDVVHRPGKSHQNADSLSRLPCRQCGRSNHKSAESPSAAEVAVTEVQIPGPHTGETLRQLQLADPVLGPLLRMKEADTKPDTGSFPSVTKSVRRFLQIWDQLEVHAGILCRCLCPVGHFPRVTQAVIPDSLREEVLADLHEGVAGGHLGVEKTLGRLRERYYWPGHYNDVRDWCRDCAACASRKTPTPKARAPLQPIATSYPMQLVATDILGPLPESPGGNSYILVVADYFTRYVEAYAIPNQEAVTVAQRLVDEFFLRFSPPARLHSDQGRNFESAVIAEACKLLGVDKSRTTPYHPQSDGLVERFNRTLLDMLATAVGENPFEWEKNLRRLCFAYNTSVHPTTGFSPFSLMFGRQPRVPMDIVLGTATQSPSTVPEYVVELQRNLNTAYARVRDQMGHQQLQQKAHYDSKVQGRSFDHGDLVWLHNPATPRGKCRKLHKPWTGPFRVVSRLSDTVYRLQDTRCRRRRPTVHFNRLKPCSPGVRIPGDIQRQGRQQPQPQPLVGTRLELVDDDDTTQEAAPAVMMPAPQQSSPMTGAGDASNIASPQLTLASEQSCSPFVSPPPPTSPSRRYPQRTRKAPDWLYPSINH